MQAHKYVWAEFHKDISKVLDPVHQPCVQQAVVGIIILLIFMRINILIRPYFQHQQYLETKDLNQLGIHKEIF